MSFSRLIFLAFACTASDAKKGNSSVSSLTSASSDLTDMMIDGQPIMDVSEADAICGNATDCVSCLEMDGYDCVWTAPSECRSICVADTWCYGKSDDGGKKKGKKKLSSDTVEGICDGARMDREDAAMCSEMTNCASCVDAVKHDGDNCLWFESEGFCAPGCNMIGCGNDTCAEPIETVSMVDANETFDGADMEEAQEFLVPCVETRYTAWNDLDTVVQKLANRFLNYRPSSWNVENTNKLEDRAWQTLRGRYQRAAAVIGFDEESWDCWVNHFEGYDYDELEAEGLEVHVETLGWDADAWDSDSIDSSDDDSFEKDWEELSEAEIAAATALCYFQENWDQVDLEQYTWKCSV